MKTETWTPAQMETRICRYKDLKSVKDAYAKEKGIPPEAYAAIAADETFCMMAPEGWKSATGEKAPVVGGDGGSVFTVNIARCPPGNGPGLHAHHTTHETFLCLDGRFLVKWGDKGEHETVLEPYDMIAMPPHVMRNFTNVSDRTANLLVFIQGEPDAFRDIEYAPEVGRDFEQRFGREVRAKFEEFGISFTAGVESEAAR